MPGRVVRLDDVLRVRRIGGVPPARELDVELPVRVRGILFQVKRPSVTFGSSASTGESSVNVYVPYPRLCELTTSAHHQRPRSRVSARCRRPWLSTQTLLVELEK
jgi:hypothetical protein